MKPYYRSKGITIYNTDCLAGLRALPARSIQCAVTSPPYWGLRDYGVPRQLGLEPTPEEYTAHLVEVFREVRRVLKDDGTLWLNLGDSYAGSWGAQGRGGPASSKSTLDGGKCEYLSKVQIAAAPKRTNTGSLNGHPTLKPKDLVGIPWRVAFALQADGWYLRSDIIWHKPNPMPESVTDRPTKAHEYLFLLAKSERYYYDATAICEPAVHAGKIVTLGEKSLSRGQATGANVKPSGNGNALSVLVKNTRNKRTVWTVTTRPFRGAHFATFPPKLVEPCILAGSRLGDAVIDPFSGAATTGLVAQEHGRKYVGLELNPEYCEIAAKRLDAKPVERLKHVA